MVTSKNIMITGAAMALAFAAFSPGARANLLVDPGFEVNALTNYANVLTNFVGYQGIWGVESATISGGNGGVTPAQATRMLCMTDDGLVATQAFQATDVTTYAALIDSGGATVNLSALLNAGPNVPAGVGGVTVRFFSAANWVSSIGAPVSGSLTLDNLPGTWQTASVSTAVPVSTRWLITEVAFTNSTMLGNPGYVDAADLTVTPEPASLGLLCLGGLLLIRRRSVT